MSAIVKFRADGSTETYADRDTAVAACRERFPNAIIGTDGKGVSHVFENAAKASGDDLADCTIEEVP